MTAYQTQFNAYVAIKAQSGLGVPASGGSAAILPIVSGHGQLSKKMAQSMQNRRDGLPMRGRHGTKAWQAAYKGELQLSNYEAILAGFMRASAWTVALTVDNSTGAMSSATITVSGHVVTASAGSFITSGVFVNDVHVWASGVASADRSKPLRVTGVTALTITYAEALTTVGSPASTWSLTRGRILTNPAAGSLAKTYFTLEEVNVDDGTSVYASDVRIGKIDMSMSPDGIISFDPTFVGTGTIGTTTGSSPNFTSPVETSKVVYGAVDATLRIVSADVVSLTSFNISMDLGLVAPSVAAQTVSPDVFDGVMKVTGSATVMKSDLANFTAFNAETSMALSFLSQLPNTSPIDWFSFTVPYITLSGDQFSDIKRDAGPRTETLSFGPETVGVDITGGAYRQTLLQFEVSN